MPPKEKSRFKIGVIGSINRDTIYLTDKSKIESWGGILYSLKYLNDSNIADVYPVANVGRNGYRQIIAILRRFSHLHIDFINKVHALNNHCFLHYHNQVHKCEILKGGVPPVTYSQVKPLLDCKGVMVNFISGKDIQLSALEKFRSAYTGIIYIDIHSLTLGRRRVEGGVRRYLRRPRFWKRYAACADILQINEAEFEILSGVPFSKTAGLDFFRHTLTRSDCLAVTRGQWGAALFYDKSRPKYRQIPATSVKKVYDTTGCGDVFGAGFLTEYLKTGSYIKAGQYGCRTAAMRCQIKGEVF